MIRLLLVDDHAIMRESLRTMLEREPDIKVLGEAGEGESALAECLYISPRTVETHRRNILRKLDLHNIAGLTQYAIREGLISL